VTQAMDGFIDGLEALMMGFQQSTRAVLREHELTGVQFLVLQWAGMEGPSSMSELAEFLGVRPQSVTSVVDSLEKRGWILRHGSVSDRRRMMLTLSPRALQLIKEFRAQQILKIERALGRLPRSVLTNATETIRLAQAALQALPSAPLRTGSREASGVTAVPDATATRHRSRIG